MIFGWLRRRTDSRAALLYQRAVADARRPVLYERFGVPDTVEGRFELVLLNVGLLVRRLTAEDDYRDLARDLSETFFTDMDRTLREMGTGDLSVAKKMKRVASAFYGRLQAYAGARDEAALAAALTRNVYAGAEHPASAALARHVAAASAVLAAIDAEAIAAGRYALPDPAAALREETDR